MVIAVAFPILHDALIALCQCGEKIRRSVRVMVHMCLPYAGDTVPKTRAKLKSELGAAR